MESLKSNRLCKIATNLFMKSPRNTADLLTDIDTFLRKRFIYAPEAIETLLTPEYMLAGLEMTGSIVGDCDDISTLHAALLTCVGVTARFVAIRSTFSDPNFDHVYVEAQLGNEWIPYDITIPLGTPIEYFARINIQV